MFEIFQKEKVIAVCMFTLFGLSMLIRILLGALYQNMIKETDNMAATDNRLLKQCKIKFANCYQLNNGVANIPVFVDKFLNRLSLGPFSFTTLYHLSGQTMLLSVVCAGLGICKSIMDGRMLGEILPFYIVSFFGLYLYFSISTVVDIKGKKRVLKVNLVDYLENHLSTKIDVTEQDMEMLYGNRRSRSRNARLSGGYGKRTIELVPINRNIPMLDEAEEIRQAEDTEKIPQTGRRTEPASDAAEEWGMAQSKISEEELESLLKEFLMV